jgi:hypothetical protein
MPSYQQAVHVTVYVFRYFNIKFITVSCQAHNQSTVSVVPFPYRLANGRIQSARPPQCVLTVRPPISQKCCSCSPLYTRSTHNVMPFTKSSHSAAHCSLTSADCHSSCASSPVRRSWSHPYSLLPPSVSTLANFSQPNPAEASVFCTLWNKPSSVAVPVKLHN